MAGKPIALSPNEPVQANSTRAALFAASAVALALGYLVARAIVASRLGKVLICIRDAESRTRFIGYRVEHVKLWIFVLSAVLAGIVAGVPSQMVDTSAA